MSYGFFAGLLQSRKKANPFLEEEIPFKQPTLEELSQVPEYKADHFNGLNIGILHFTGNHKHEFLLHEFEELGKLCNGRNIVKKYLHKTTRQQVAIKFINIPTYANDDTFNELRKEIELHLALRHSKHIVDLFGFNILDDQLIICIELMDMSAYDFYISTHKRINSFPGDLLGLIGINIVNALIDCKLIKIIHRDIKPQNILINKSGHIKLCDFGTSRLLENSFATTLTTGTYLYFPPEKFDPSIEKYDVRSDVWSLGLTLAEIGYGKHPLGVPKHISIFKLGQIITKVDGAELVEECLAAFSNDIKLFVKLCLERLENRPKLGGLRATNLYQHYSKLNHPTYIQSLISQIEPM